MQVDAGGVCDVASAVCSNVDGCVYGCFWSVLRSTNLWTGGGIAGIYAF